MPRFIDLTGKKFGRWTVIKRSFPNKGEQPVWLCKCDCGKEKIVMGNSLRKGDSKSCGCLSNELKSARRKLDSGLANMRTVIRQYKANAKRRGVGWNLTEEQFKEITQKDCFYCGEKPNNLTKQICNGEYIYNGIDRIDNTKGYVIDNIVPCCRRCNRAKDISTLQEYKNWIRKSYNYMFNKEEKNI